MSNQTEKPNLLVVLGATGHQGSSVLKYFASQPNHLSYRLRGTTRNVNSASSRSLQALGVEMVQADAFDVQSLKRAFAGATHIFANTDSNQHIFDALTHPEKLAPGQSAAKYGAEIEIGLGRNVVDAVAASAQTIEKIIWSTLPSPKKWSHGKYTKVAMFDAKDTIAEMFLSKSELVGKLSFLMVGFYADNAGRVPMLYGPKKQPDGVYQLSLPMSGDIPVPFADVEADTGAWVVSLFNAPAGVTLVGASEFLSWSGWLEMWGKHHNVQTRYREQALSEFPAELEGMKDAIYEELKFIEEFGFTGGNKEVVDPEKLRQTGVDVQASSIADHIQRYDWSNIL